MVEIDGEKLMVSSSNFDDGSMIVSVGTTDFDNYGDSDFMEMMINKDGKIDYFTLPTGKGNFQRSYKIKPSHYGVMKTQNETNESAGGDFIRTDGDGKYGTSFGAESFASYDMPISERQRYRIRKLGGRIDKAMNRSDASRYIKSLMLDIHGAESFAASDPKFGGVIAIDSMFDSENDECRVCEGFGYYFPNDASTLGRTCEKCVKGWIIEVDEDDKFKTGVKLGAGAAVGFTAVSIGFGIAAGVLGLIYQKVAGE
jgi:hypothetical protein